ncbi:type II secretion system protein M [Microbacterium sp. NC79]|nr:type II secretion system protein M [Microbacterium sp. NC79]
MMSTPRPRRHSPAVYRRRRIVVFGGLLVFILAIVLLIWQPWSSATPSPSPTTSGSPSATAPADAAAANDGTTEANGTAETNGTADGAQSAESGGEGETTPVEELPTEQPEAEIVACGPQDVRVDASTDKSEYGADELPQLTLSLTNLTARDCTIDVGTAAQSFTITSGNDVWWRSTDCQANPTNQIVTLAAGQTAASQVPLVWDRTRSSVSTCADETRPRAGGGGASYHLTVTIASFESQGSAQFMLY